MSIEEFSTLKSPDILYVYVEGLFDNLPKYNFYALDLSEFISTKFKGYHV
jgi:hypothetical protein